MTEKFKFAAQSNKSQGTSTSEDFYSPIEQVNNTEIPLNNILPFLRDDFGEPNVHNYDWSPGNPVCINIYVNTWRIVLMRLFTQ